jgi:hypothetical protein
MKMTERTLCPYEVAQTRQLAISGQEMAVHTRVESGAEHCEGLPKCEGPSIVEIERNRIIGIFLGRYTTKEVCPLVQNTIQR